MSLNYVHTYLWVNMGNVCLLQLLPKLTYNKSILSLAIVNCHLFWLQCLLRVHHDISSISPLTSPMISGPRAIPSMRGRGDPRRGESLRALLQRGTGDPFGRLPQAPLGRWADVWMAGNRPFFNSFVGFGSKLWYPWPKGMIIFNRKPIQLLGVILS